MDVNPTVMSVELLCPHIPDPSVVETLLKENYGMTTMSLKPLNGYDDKNYMAKIMEEHTNPYLDHISNRQFFVKIVNSKDSKNPDFVHNQRLVMEHLKKLGIACQEEIKTLNGDFFSRLTVDKDGTEESCMVSVRTFLPGTILGDHTATPPLLYALGSYMARVHTHLESFHQDFYDSFDCTWSLNNVGNVRSAIHAVQDTDNKRVVLEILNSFDTDVLPRRDQFRKAQIHGDPNEQNILVIPDDKAASGFVISGLLDFQDTALTHPIYDLGILSGYIMMMPKMDAIPIDAAGYVIAGYESVKKLLVAERECLRTLTASRMAMSLVYGAYTYMENPENDYVITTAKKGWSAMTEFWNTPKEFVNNRWDEIIQTYDPTCKCKQ